MPTKISPSRSPGRSGARSRPRARSAKKAPAKTPVRAVLSPWARDALGIGLLVLALLAVLSLWLEAGGPLGNAIAWTLPALFGVGAYAFPAVGLWWGIVLLRDTAREDRVRMFIGFCVLLLGALGIVSLAMGNPGFGAGWDGVDDRGFGHAGGVLGVVGAWPLSRVLSPAGAAIVCGGLAVLGLLIFTGTPFSVIVERVRAFREERQERDPVGADAEEDREPRFRWSWRELFGLQEPEDADVVLVPDAEQAEATEAIPVPEDDRPDEGFSSGPVPVAGRGSRSRTITTPRGPYQLPPLDLLRTAPPSNADARAEQDTLAALERTLETFGVDARVVAAHRGPTVTMYEVAVASGTKVNKVLGLSSDIAYALATPDVRIQAPIPGKSAIGVEVPNVHRDFVMLGDVLRSPAAKQARHPLEVALGKDVHGRARLVNLAEMPHLLIAGATGAGKSSLVNSFITSILMRTTPEDVRLVLVDPKRVELSHFGDVPHLLSPVIVHPKRAAEALQWLVREMETRYELLVTVGVRDIDSYEEGLREDTLRIPPGMEETFEHLPFIVVVIDELADLMMVAPRDVEDAICRIAQMARAVGIHLVVATQRPSVDVVTGLIKANIPSRIALMTSSQADSRVILDMNGAEKLVGHGDMLFAPSNVSKPIRIQGAWVTEAEVRAVSEFIRAQREVEYENTVEGLALPPGEGAGEHGLGDDDELLEQAAELVIRSQLGSTSMLQRKLKVGFARAGRLMDLMEERGIVGPSQGSKARDVLVTWEEWEDRRSA
ncbi:MAG TPA: DNA translocase FtsK 4TM domain-containing protein [Actinomycetota bacterium]|nr:DNA translocase FtsK 4TM domain-containing protein [Actinomycetota bacterium]